MRLRFIQLLIITTAIASIASTTFRSAAVCAPAVCERSAIVFSIPSIAPRAAASAAEAPPTPPPAVWVAAPEASIPPSHPAPPAHSAADPYPVPPELENARLMQQTPADAAAIVPTWNDVSINPKPAPRCAAGSVPPAPPRPITSPGCRAASALDLAGAGAGGCRSNRL